jgi:hypothetical protein
MDTYTNSHMDIRKYTHVKTQECYSETHPLSLIMSLFLYGDRLQQCRYEQKYTYIPDPAGQIFIAFAAKNKCQPHLTSGL